MPEMAARSPPRHKRPVVRLIWESDLPDVPTPHLNESRGPSVQLWSRIGARTWESPGEPSLPRPWRGPLSPPWLPASWPGPVPRRRVRAGMWSVRSRSGIRAGSRAPATLFSSFDQQTIDTHFRWMQQHGCDTAALQRFNPNSSEGPTRDAMAVKVRSAAETFGCKFYIMYDVTGWASMQSEIKTDWTSKMSAHVGSGAYARQNGKPVVCIWGFGFNDNNHPWDANTCLDVVNWFKGQGCYVIGGVPREWRTGVGGSRAGFSDVYHAFHMLSPWMVGAISTAADSDWMYQNINLPDVADCTAHGIDYQPCVLPGDVSARQRAHGDFMWRQFYNMVRVGAQGIYISMFDEYNEGNQIAKTAETGGTVPAGSGILAL